jgi:hypothetical protein
VTVLCHRCGASLTDSTLFCPTCGAPQVRFEAHAEGEQRAGESPRPSQPLIQSQGVSWKDATAAALLVSVPSGILSAISVLSWGCCLWVVGGAVLSIALYHKRAPGFHLDARSGLRIGMLAGLIAAYTSVAVTAIWRVFARFVLHQGAAIDHFYDMVIQQSTAIVQTNPEAEAQWHQYVHFLMSPDGRAAYTLLNSFVTGAGIVVLSAAGGALGVRLFAARKPSLGNP